MDGRPVLVSTQDEDATADLVIAELNRRRVPVVRFDPGRDFPVSAALTARLGPAGWCGTFTNGGHTADLGNVRALYHRRPSAYTAKADSQDSNFAARESRRGLGGVLASLPGCLYLSHPQAIARAEYKPAQLATARVAGFTVPATVITNDLVEARNFTAAQPTIYKPLHAAAYSVEGEPAFDLRYGAFDFALTADGAWWFLECNPNGQWAWLEAAAGLPLTAAIADLLENGETLHA
ncbi:hypothetical protein OIU91_25245 [Streptomyces sp. NBC_01456]|uniref:MvdC/MvdD family ATP grasp protein n=1 Tax=unclassified Streptomyces TaxID=2593676 RepID=UPI002E3407F1|nr:MULTISPECIES: hypothetical protein [unclassified Streptomyces]